MKYIYVFIALLFSTGLSAQDRRTDSIRSFFYKYRYYDSTTSRNRAFGDIDQMDIEGNRHVRDTANQKPCFIYYFTAHCAPCSFEMPMVNKLYEEFKDSIDFLTFTPIREDLIAELYPKPKAPKCPIISVPRSFFKTGFPCTYILDKQSNVVFRKIAGAITDENLKVHHQVLREWCEKALNR